MNKVLFDMFDDLFDDDFELASCEMSDIERHECSEEKEEVLIALAKKLTSDDISFIVCEWMKQHNEHLLASRAYDESTGNKLLHFRMEAEFGYYLDDIPYQEDEEDD